MMKPVVIWDFNGTILDDFDLCLLVINRMLAQRGLPRLTAADYRDHFDFPVKDYYHKLGFDFNQEPFPELAAEYMSQYQPESFFCPLRRHALQVLADIRSQEIEQVLLSATSQDFLGQQACHFGLETYFSNILGLGDILGNSKLDRACRWFAQNGYLPEGALLIGDTTHDHEVARALHCRCVLVSGGHNSRERLVKTGVPVLSSLAEIAGMMANFPLN
jgi:phosphoglycolate phosphatase